MKPVQIALLVVAGAVGGAIIVKVSERPQPAAETTAPSASQEAVPAAAQNPPSSEAQPVAAGPEQSEPGTAVKAKPAPFARRARSKHEAVPKSDSPEPQAVEVAQNAPPPAVTTAAPAAAPGPQPAPEIPPPAPSNPEPVAPPPPPPPARQVTLNAGMLVSVRLIDSLTTERNNAGDTFTGSLDKPLIVDDLVIAEKGARVEGKVVSSDKGGKVSGVASLSVALTRIHLSDGQTISVQTDSFQRQAPQTHTTDAEKIGGGAIIGAVIGAIAGGGKGAAIGAGAGGGVGAGDVMLTRGKPATLASETRIDFRINAPITVTEKHS
jgi:hypothetical protein